MLIGKITFALKSIATFKNWPRYFLTYFGFCKAKEIEFKFRNGIKLQVPGGSIMDSIPLTEVWTYQIYNPNEFDLHKEDIVVDIGAHIGTFSVYAASKSPQGCVYSYEPVVENFDFLKRNIKLNNLTNVIPINKGVFRSRGQVKVYSSSSLATYSVYGKGKGTRYVKVIGLKDVFTDNSLKKIDFLKLDCEGAEYEILFNTPKEYIDKINKIVLEYHEGDPIKYSHHDLLNFLRNHNLKTKLLITGKGTNGLIYAQKGNKNV